MEKTDQKPLQKEKRTRSAGRIAGMAAGIAVGVLAAAYLAVCIAAAAGRTTLHRTQVLGVDVGGLTAQEVRDKWQRDGADACSGEVIHLTLGEETIGQVSLSELGVSVTPQEAAQAAWNAAHGGNFFVNGYHLIRSWFGETQAAVRWDLDAAQLSQRAESLSRELSRDPVDGAYRMEEGKGDGFYVTKPADGRTIDRDKLARALHQAVTTRCLDPIERVSTVTQGNYICQKLLSCFSAAGGALTLLGTRGTAPARHEGRAGWKASDYCTKAADGTYTNPFYNNGFDFSHYMTTQAYTGVGVVVLQLGINDIFYAGLDSFSAAATIGYLDTMVNSILNYDSSIKVIVDLLTPPNGNPSVFTEKYGTGQIDFVYRMNTIRMSKALMEHFSGNISVAISPNNCVLDPAQDINDGVHPTEGGYAKLGQMIYETMLGVHSGDSGGGQVTPLWDMTGRTGVQWQEYSDGTVGRSFGTDKYYYPMSFTGTTQSPTAATMTDFAAGTDTLEFTIQTGSASASQLSGYGIVVPLALEAGKSYTFAAKCASTNSGVNLMTYNVSGGVWTYVSNARVCYSTTELCSASITPEAGKGYAICFSQKSGGVGTKNVFSQISLKEA